jgi:hypothetical protein
VIITAKLLFVELMIIGERENIRYRIGILGTVGRTPLFWAKRMSAKQPNFCIPFAFFPFLASKILNSFEISLALKNHLSLNNYSFA